jgi:hypothetical protein
LLELNDFDDQTGLELSDGTDNRELLSLLLSDVLLLIRRHEEDDVSDILFGGEDDNVGKYPPI